MPATRQEVLEMQTKPVLKAMGAINYAVKLRWDLALPMHVLARNMAKPAMETWTGIKGLLQYCNSTLERKRCLDCAP